MIMEVEIISKELIKPTSPTPHHLRTYLFSFLDQSHPPVYVPMVLFYTNQQADVVSSNSRSQLLKESLAETLTLFYPFAGRFKDNLSVDCNDEGTYYVESRVNHRLCEFLKLKDLSYISRLVPVETSWGSTSPVGYLAMIQVNTFACGGIVICASISHMIADGPTATAFLSSWAAATRKCGEELARPNFDASFMFPQNVAYPKEAIFSTMFTPFFKKGICGSMRIVFNASAIDSLKAKTSSPSVPNPTRVEAVSALLSKCIMDALETKSTLVTHAVNLRRRAVPNISKDSMGNFVYMATTLVEDERELDKLVCRLRKAIRRADSDFVANIKGDGGWLKFCEYTEEMGESLAGACDGTDFIVFTSWCNFGLYEIDFGWGKPAWVSSAVPTKTECVFPNLIFLLDTKMGNGIEALVFLDEEHVVKLEQNKELLAFGSLEG